MIRCLSANLCWFLWQFYLLVFWPSRFEQEVETPSQRRLRYPQRAVYLLKLLPWIIAFAVPGNLIAGRLCQHFGVDYNWDESWRGMAGGVAFPLAFCVTYFRFKLSWTTDAPFDLPSPLPEILPRVYCVA